MTSDVIYPVVSVNSISIFLPHPRPRVSRVVKDIESFESTAHRVGNDEEEVGGEA